MNHRVTIIYDVIRSHPTQAISSITAELSSQTWAALAASKRVYDRLDWWELDDWRNSDALMALPAKKNDSIAAALLVVPIAFTNLQQLASASQPAAWLRWCAVADRQSPSALLRGLLHEAEQRLNGTPVRQLWCVCEPHEWLATNLRDLGFKPCDELITMSRLSSQPPLRNRTPRRLERRSPIPCELRTLNPQMIDERELAQIHALDEAAFAPNWRYSAYMLRRAFAQSRYITVAEQHNHIVGYQCATYDEDNADSIAHITRLVVQPCSQGQGIGAALFEDCVLELVRLGAREITLNTPASNLAAQKLYRRFEFVPLTNRMTVMCKHLEETN